LRAGGSKKTFETLPQSLRDSSLGDGAKGLYSGKLQRGLDPALQQKRGCSKMKILRSPIFMP